MAATSIKYLTRPINRCCWRNWKNIVLKVTFWNSLHLQHTYLTDRYETVKLSNILNNNIVLERSIVDPLLFFTIFNNLITKFLIYPFADGTAVVYSSHNRGQLVEKVNSELFYRHRLFPNSSKIKIVSFGYKNVLNLNNCITLPRRPDFFDGCQCPSIC